MVQGLNERKSESPCARPKKYEARATETLQLMTEKERKMKEMSVAHTMKCLVACIVLLMVAPLAQAHPGHAEGGMAGLLHPLTGLDHLLAMVAVGIWAALLGKQARWLVPLSFLAVMSVTAVAGMAGLMIPAVEPGIAASVLLAGLLIGLRVRIGAAAGAVIVALFACFHGFAHGAELPADAQAWRYIAGFVFSTAVLHAAGVGLGVTMMKWKTALPATGALLFAGGGWMLAGLN